MKTKDLLNVIIACGLSAFLSACASDGESINDPRPGPDKQGLGMMTGAASGAGAGAIAGFQMAAGSGPGAVVGAGFGAVAGSIRGMAQDSTEDQVMALTNETQAERERAVAHEILEDQYKRRMALHPTRDIFPADLFFAADSAKLRPGAEALIDELARINSRRLPYSRLVIAVYTKAREVSPSGEPQKSEFARYISETRAREIVNHLITAGLEPPRLEAKGIIVAAPIVIDPHDDPLRFAQAVEIIAVDR